MGRYITKLSIPPPKLHYISKGDPMYTVLDFNVSYSIRRIWSNWMLMRPCLPPKPQLLSLLVTRWGPSLKPGPNNFHFWTYCCKGYGHCLGPWACPFTKVCQGYCWEWCQNVWRICLTLLMVVARRSRILVFVLYVSLKVLIPINWLINPRIFM